MSMLHRTIHPEVRVLDEKAGVVEYIASDETLDSYREVIKANGWKFNLFAKNAPFVNSHRYESISDMLGNVVEFGVVKKKLREVVKWSIDVEENAMARFGYKMTQAGYLKAVSVGFKPVKSVSRWSNGESFAQWEKELAKLSIEDGGAQPDRIYLEQEQIELSAVVIGANPNALVQMTAKAYKAEVIDDDDIQWLSGIQHNFAERNERAIRADQAAEARIASRRRFLNAFDKNIEQLKKG
jgi:hypothetical protein